MAGIASPPVLHCYKGSMTQSTYQGYGRQGTHYKKGSDTQVKLRSPAYPLFILFLNYAP